MKVPGKILFGLLLFLLASSWRQERIWFSVFQAGVLLLIACSGRRIPSHPLAWAMLALPCFGILQLAFGSTAYPWRTAVATLDWTVFAAVGWLAYQFFAGAPNVQKGLIITGLAVCIVSLAHWYTSPGRIFWIWPNPYALLTPFPLLNHTQFAALVELAAAPAIFAAMQAGPAWRFSTWAAAAMVAAVWAVGSRSGSVIVAAEIGAVILLTLRTAPLKRFTRRRAILVAGPATILIAGIGWQGLAARAKEASHDEMRPAFMAATIEMIKTRPLAGFGLGTWETVYPAFATIDPGLSVEHAHNDWLEWAAEGGVPFASVMLGMAVFAFRRAWREPWCLGMGAVFVQSIVDFPLHKPALLGFVFAGLGYLAAYRPVVATITGTKSSISSAKLA